MSKPIPGIWPQDALACTNNDFLKTKKYLSLSICQLFCVNSIDLTHAHKHNRNGLGRKKQLEVARGDIFRAHILGEL